MIRRVLKPKLCAALGLLPRKKNCRPHAKRFNATCVTIAIARKIQTACFAVTQLREKLGEAGKPGKGLGRSDSLDYAPPDKHRAQGRNERIYPYARNERTIYQTKRRTKQYC